MIYTPSEYSKVFLFSRKLVSAMTIKRRCRAGMLPSGHTARKLPGKTGAWIIEVKESRNGCTGIVLSPSDALKINQKIL